MSRFAWLGFAVAFGGLCFAVFLGISSLGYGPDRSRPGEPRSTAAFDADADEQVRRVEDRIKRFGGHMVTGRLVMDGRNDFDNVVSQMRIMPDGSFTAAVKDFQNPLTFRAHQFAPLDVSLQGKEGDKVDIGVIKMERVPAADLVSVHGKLVMEGSDSPTRATLTLAVAMGPNNSWMGIEPRPKWADPITLKIDQSGEFQGDSFSPIRYRCRIVADGYVTKELPANLTRREKADLGIIQLERTRPLDLEFIVSFAGPFKIESLQKATVQGGGQWKATPENYGWDLDFKQQNGNFLLRYTYGPCWIVDLGQGELKDHLNVSETVAEEGRQPQDVPVIDGHVYLVKQGHFHRNILLKPRLKASQ